MNKTTVELKYIGEIRSQGEITTIKREMKETDKLQKVKKKKNLTSRFVTDRIIKEVVEITIGEATTIIGKIIISKGEIIEENKKKILSLNKTNKMDKIIEEKDKVATGVIINQNAVAITIIIRITNKNNKISMKIKEVLSHLTNMRVLLLVLTATKIIEAAVVEEEVIVIIEVEAVKEEVVLTKKDLIKTTIMIGSSKISSTLKVVSTKSIAVKTTKMVEVIIEVVDRVLRLTNINTIKTMIIKSNLSKKKQLKDRKLLNRTLSSIK